GLEGFRLVDQVGEGLVVRGRLAALGVRLGLASKPDTGEERIQRTGLVAPLVGVTRTVVGRAGHQAPLGAPLVLLGLAYGSGTPRPARRPRSLPSMRSA